MGQWVKKNFEDANYALRLGKDKVASSRVLYKMCFFTCAMNCIILTKIVKGIFLGMIVLEFFGNNVSVMLLKRLVREKKVDK